jgi:hypothetical protein
MLYRPYRPGLHPATTITGRNLAYRHMTAPERAFAAADLRLGRTTLKSPTRKQAATLAKVSVPYALAAERIAFEQPHLRVAYERGEEPLIKPKSDVEVMAAGWAAMSEAQRVALVRLIGPEAAFEVVCSAV